MLDKILREESKNICKRYRVKEKEARSLLEEKIKANLFLLEKIKQARDFSQLKRSEAYKKFIKKARREIYYNLRRYHQDEAEENKLTVRLEKLVKSNEGTNKEEWQEIKDGLTSLHISTWERKLYLKEFNQKVVEIVKNEENILDIGSGIYPLSFSFDEAGKLENYICLEKDKKAVRVLKLFSHLVKKNLLIFNEAIGAKDWGSYLPEGAEKFDVVFMFKLIPVIYRQERNLLKVLARVPGKKIIITANKEAMTKRKEIKRREDRVLRYFIGLTDKKIIEKLDFGNEFGYLLGASRP